MKIADCPICTLPIKFGHLAVMHTSEKFCPAEYVGHMLHSCCALEKDIPIPPEDKRQILFEQSVIKFTQGVKPYFAPGKKTWPMKRKPLKIKPKPLGAKDFIAGLPYTNDKLPKVYLADELGLYIDELEHKLEEEKDGVAFLEKLLKTLYGEGWDKLTISQAKQLKVIPRAQAKQPKVVPRKGKNDQTRRHKN